MAFDKTQLFVGSFDEEEVELPGKGTVRVRALSRAEMQKLMNKNKGGQEPTGLEVEIRMVVAGMVDPEIDVDDAKLWSQRATPGEWQRVCKAITRLSKGDMDDEEEEKLIKETYTEFPK